MTIIMTSKRTLIKGLFAFGIASPVIIRPENLMAIDSPDNRIVIAYKTRMTVETGRIVYKDYPYGEIKELDSESIVNYLPGNNLIAKINLARKVYRSADYDFVRKGDIDRSIYRNNNYAVRENLDYVRMRNKEIGIIV